MKSKSNKSSGSVRILALWFMSLFLFMGNMAFSQANCERLVWQDEFDASSLDLTKWGYETGDGCPTLCQWGTGQLDYSTDRQENVRLENGKLVLELRKENYSGREYTSGRIRTYQKKNFRYGRIEARVKGLYSQGPGFAFWMLGSSFESVSWPKCGEIDIFEQTGRAPDYNIGTAHFQDSWGHAWNQGKFWLPNQQRFADDFHTVGLEWTPDSMRWYIDGQYYHTFHISKPINGYDPFNRDFFIILSVGMGGDYSGPPDATTVTPQKVEVDYVRVYEGTYSTSIDGDKRVYEGDLNKEFSTKAVTGATYNWSVPNGSTIVSGQGTNKILVNFGSNSGKVILNQTVPNCGSNTYSKEVEVQKAIIVSKVFDDFETKRNCTYDYRSGAITEAVNNPANNYINSSSKVGKYVRNIVEAWDAMVMLNVDPGHAGEYVQGKKRLFIDVYTDAPVGTKVAMGFENTAATVDQPYGKHSNYAAYTTKQNAWERLEFVLTDIPDKYAGSYKVNKFVLMFDPGNKSGNTYYFDNLRSGQSGPDATVLSSTILENWNGTSNLPLRSKTGTYLANQPNPSASGINTSSNVLKYTRNSAEKYDNIAYKFQLDDASLFREGTNTLLFDVYTSAAPGKVISVHFEDSTISAAADWQAPIHSIYEGRVDVQNQWQTVELKWSSTPNANVPNVNVNKLIFLFDENSSNGDVYYIDNIRINSRKQPESYILNKIIEDFDVNKYLGYVWTGEELTAPFANPYPTGINTSANVAKYVRHDVNANDWLVYDVKTTIDAKALREKTKVFAMDVYTNAPVGKVITIGLEAGSLANSGNWPTGRHSDYSTATKVQNQWHTVKFIYSTSADPSTPDNLVNKLTFTFNQGQPGNYTYYFDNVRILESIKDTVLNSIVVTPALTENVAINQTIQFNAAGKDQFGNAFPSKPVWSVSGGGTISTTGLFKATANGVYKVSAVDGTVMGSADVLIGESIKLTKIVMSPPSATIYQGGSTQLTASGYDQLNRPITISNPVYSISPAGASIANGLFASNTPGVYTVTITSGTVSTSSVITVRATPVLTTLTISPLETKIFLNGSQQFSATTLDQYGDRITVVLTWSAVGATISSSGLFSASAIGTYVVKVQSGDKQASTYISVVETPQNIALNKPATVSSEENYGTVVTYVNDGNATTRWASNATDAQWVKIDLQNTYNLSSVVLNWESAYGKSYDIKVSTNNVDFSTIASETNGSAGKKTYNVNAAARYIMLQGITRGTPYGYSLYEFEVYGVLAVTPALKSIVVSPNYTEVNSGTTQQFTYKAFDQFGNNFAVTPTWSVTGGSINTSGLYTANTVGTFNVTATSGSVSNTAQIKVKGNAAPTVSITTPANNAVFQKGSNVAVTINAADSDGSVSKVELFANGASLKVFTAAPYTYTWTAPATGTYDLTAKATDNLTASTTSAIVKVKVNNPPTVSITAPAANASIDEGTALTATATAADTDGSIAKVEFFVDGVSKGSKTASPFTLSITGIAAGNHTLTAVATDNDNATITSSAVAFVVKPVIIETNIALNKPATASTVLGGNNAAAAVDGNAANTRWESAHGVENQWIAVDLQSNYNITKVVLKWETASAKAYRIEVSTDNVTWTPIYTTTTSVGGNETLTVTGAGRYIRMYGTQRNTGWGYSLWEFEVYGNAGPVVAVTGVSVTPATASVAAGSTTQLTATVAPSNATNKNVTWTSSNTAIATVSSTGLVSGVAAGSANITVTTQDGNKTATSVITVTITNVPVTGVTLAPTTTTLNAGSTAQLTATIAPLNATNKNVTWASSNTAVATVSATGLVTAVAVGAANITVTTVDGSKIATCAVTVQPISSNLALNKPVTATSTQAGLLTTALNDGNNGTRWSSDWSDLQSVTIDLQASYTITKVVLNWEGACGKNYTVEVSSDNVSWTTIYTTTSGISGILTINPTISATGRYIRMNGTLRATGWGYSLWEFEVYGNASALKSAKIAVEATAVSKLNDNVVMIYPNPVTNILTVSLSDNSAFNNLMIFDLAGKLVAQRSLELGEISVKQDFSNLKSGNYILKLNGISSSETFKIVKR